MVNLFFITGGLWVLLMSICRHIFLQNKKGFWNSIKAIFRVPKIDGNPNEVLLVIGQTMGFLWLFLGIFFAIAERTLATSTIGIFAEGFGIFLPPILAAITIRTLTIRIKKKKL